MPSSPVDFSKSYRHDVLSGRSVLITGGASGIGRGITECAAASGAYVTVLDMNKTDGVTMVKALTDQGYHAFFIHTDVTSFESQQVAFKQAIELVPTHNLDHVIACAGLSGNSIVSTLGADPATASLSIDPPAPNTRVLETTFMGVYYTVHLALYYFAACYNARGTENKPDSARSKERKHHILIVGSIESYGNQPNRADYPAAKWGVRGMWRGIRNSSTLISPPGSSGIRMNFLAPGLVETPMTAHQMPFLTSIGLKAASIGNATAAAMRLMCDEEIDGRSVAVGPAEEGGALDSGCMDLLDEHANFDGSPKALEFLRDVIGPAINVITGMNSDELDEVIGKGNAAIVR